MQKQSIVFGVAGVFFGLLVGWIIGSQQPGVRSAPLPAAPAQAAAGGQAQQPAPALDESRAAALKVVADRNPSDSVTRVQLGDLYFDAERYADAMQWYEAAMKIDPKNVNASTDLGITYYYMNQPDRALAQFDRSLAIDPKHAKTLLNQGIVRAFGKNDFRGAAQAWQTVVEVAPPESPEAAKARQGLDGLRAAHPEAVGGKPAEKGGQ
jgi:cytochrome c-type biogenesis protein CcmH/NrfG